MEAAQLMQYHDHYAANAVVIGLNKTGLSCAAYLVGEGYNVEIADTRQSPPLQRVLQSELPGVTLFKGATQPRVFMDADVVVLTGNAVSDERIAQQARQYGCEVVSSLELFALGRTAPVALVAGANGKSTVLDMVKDVIVRTDGRVRLGGTSSVPVLDMLSGADPDAYLVEASSLSMLAQTRSLSCDVAAFLNAAQDLGSDSDLKSHESDLRRVFRTAKTIVVNRDDALAASLKAGGECIRFGAGAPERDSDYGIAEQDGTRWLVRGNRRLADVTQFAVNGSHNELNILAAIAILQSLGRSAQDSAALIRNYQGLPYCCSQIGSYHDGVRWINDSKSTNLNASIAAVQSSPNPVVLIAGGVSRGADFSELAKKVNGNLRGCVLFGRDGSQIRKSVKKYADSAYVENIFDAVAVAAQMARNGDDVVFSPGCEPFDMFIDHVFRGQVFAKAVKNHYS